MLLEFEIEFFEIEEEYLRASEMSFRSFLLGRAKERASDGSTDRPTEEAEEAGSHLHSHSHSLCGEERSGDFDTERVQSE